MKTSIGIATAFKNASPDSRRLNPHLFNKNDSTGRTGTRRGIRKGMNKTEREFSLILEAMKRRGEILRYEYEGITLRWAGIRYTPDFVVFDQTDGHWGCRLKMVEIKGAFIKGKFERAIERFRHARTYWPEFSFELHQKTNQGWMQIL